MAPEKGHQRTYHFLFPASQLLLRTKKRPAERIGGSFAERGVLSKHERYKAIFALVAEYQNLSPISILF